MKKDPYILNEYEGHSWAVSSVRFSPDEKEIYSVGMDSIVHIWSVSRKKKIKEFKGHKHWIQTLDCSKNGKFLATGSRGRIIRIWNTQIHDGDSFELTEHTGYVLGVRFRENRQLVSACFDYELKIWDLELKKSISTTHTTSFADSLTLSPNKEMVAVGQFRGIEFFDFRSRKAVHRIGPGIHRSHVNSIHFHPDGNFIVTGCSDYDIRLLDVRNYKLLAFHRIYCQVRGVFFHPSGKYFTSGCAGGRVRLFSVNPTSSDSDEVIKEIFCSKEKRRGECHDVAFSSSGEFIVSGIDDSVVLWNSNIFPNTSKEKTFEMKDEKERIEFLIKSKRFLFELKILSGESPKSFWCLKVLCF